MAKKNTPKKTKKTEPKAAPKKSEVPEKLYEIKSSGIHNKGLFAKVDIPVGTRLSLIHI